jgi:hypothetical protein
VVSINRKEREEKRLKTSFSVASSATTRSLQFNYRFAVGISFCLAFEATSRPEGKNAEIFDFYCEFCVFDKLRRLNLMTDVLIL